MSSYLNRFSCLLILLFILLNPVSLAAQTDHPQDDNMPEYYVKASVLELLALDHDTNAHMVEEQLVKVEVLEGKFAGQVLLARNSLSGSAGIDIIIDKGDRVVLYITERVSETDGKSEIAEIYVVEKVRTGAQMILLGIFMALLVLIGGFQGIKALVGLGFTGLGIFMVLLPALAEGRSPLLVTLPLLVAVTLLTMLVVAGFSRKALAATLGTTGGLMVAGLIAVLVGGDLASLQGLGTEEERLLLYIENVSINTRGILFAGILLGALGAIMDVAMSVASAIEEVKKANPALTQAQLTRAGMQVGRDVMGTMVNTLILAYAGGALPFLLLYLSYQSPAVYWLNTEFITSEILRAAAGSVGLVVSVPITAVLAGLLNRNTGRMPVTNHPAASPKNGSGNRV
ncbi:MAG: YibE/F family protein [Syntrophomonadaceae bacterium]|jgi:uncharacterized membrane protein|nr:YibE/F family protein [Syntrophomonadaceae bacterium]